MGTRAASTGPSEDPMLRPLRPLNAIHAITFGLAFVLAISPALAVTAQRTFVASHGKDTDPCSLALPCRSFNAAIAQTNPGGEVVILDPAGGCIKAAPTTPAIVYVDDSLLRECRTGIRSQFLGCDNAILFSHTATGTAFGAQLKITDSKFEHLNNGGITLSTGADAAVNVDLVRSLLTFTGNTGISMAAAGIGPAGTNWIVDNVDAVDGTVYIPPTIIPMK